MCVCKDIIHTMPMYADGCDPEESYEGSDVWAYLDDLSVSWRKSGIEFLYCEVDMLADDGTGWDEKPFIADGLFLLNKDMYRRYRRYIDWSHNEDWMWLSTKFSYSRSANYYTAHYFCYVSTDGSASSSYSRYSNGLAPAFLLKSLPIDPKSAGESTQSGIV